ncbi:polyprenyl synthetase family protein [Gordonia insulae]|uniref:(2E,6E)-farnesyl diphosphate synthase n=1 Tax=Gordonia insulae TaxID=2420509 RepID=A0A3G8JNC6_9ACTN|nr:polyprenyl synthetase family protein [Gordonia insulae]AZG46577.1 (2E,6E)-farnesyl diphosphate synthase [Gordonia insulae]
MRTSDPDVVALVDDVLYQHVEEHCSVLTGVDDELAPLTDSLRGAVGGGKRVRATFCLLGAQGASGGHRVPGVVEAAAAIELFHLAALVHDDLMDNSADRRGRPTVHRSFTEEHLRAERLGDPAAHGAAVAIMAGDLCLMWSDDLIARGLATADGTVAGAARREWQGMRDEVFAGQFLDMLSQTQSATSKHRALQVLRFKSAEYTVARPLRLGGSLAGATPDLLDRFDRIGLAAGEAFQLRDDLLGVFGDPGRTGKPVIDDIREGKRTLLVAFAEERASRSERRVLADHLGKPELTEDELRMVCEVLIRTDAARLVEERIDDLADRALRGVDDLPVDDRTKAELSALIRRCVWRDA